MDGYIINTFLSERNRFYDVAIKYYKGKTDALLKSLEQNGKNKLNNELKSTKSVEELFEKNVSKLNNLDIAWSLIYNSKLSQENIMSAIQKYNEETGKIAENFEYKIDTYVFLKQLLGEIPGGDQVDLQTLTLPKTLDLNSVKKEFSKLSHGEYGTAAAVGGARAKLFGEIFEQLAVAQIVNNIGDLMSWIQQMGTAKSYNYSGKVTSGKSDVMIAVNNVTVTEEFEQIKGKKKKVTKLQGENSSSIEIDAAEAVDLNDKKSVDELLKTYATGERAGIAGGTVKQWLSEGAKATLAHSNFTAKYINQRKPDGIEEGFKNDETFKAYTAYVLARFLVNVIGVYNILMISGSHIELTYNYLNRVKTNSLSIMHMTEMKNSIYKAKNDVYIGKNPSVVDVLK